MSLHQKLNQREYQFHPELGYLCPSPKLQQNVRVALAAAAFGIVTGVAAAMVLFPRHGGDLARAEAALAAAPPGPVSDSMPLTASSPSVAPPRGPSGTAERVSTDGVVRRLPAAAPMSPAVAAANEASPPIETPARASPVVTTDGGTAAVSGSEQSRPVASKRKKTVYSSVRRRGREPHPPAAVATSPFFSPFADGSRSGRRQDWGGGWSW